MMESIAESNHESAASPSRPQSQTEVTTLPTKENNEQVAAPRKVLKITENFTRMMKSLQAMDPSEEEAVVSLKEIMAGAETATKTVSFLETQKVLLDNYCRAMEVLSGVINEYFTVLNAKFRESPHFKQWIYSSSDKRVASTDLLRDIEIQKLKAERDLLDSKSMIAGHVARVAEMATLADEALVYLRDANRRLLKAEQEAARVLALEEESRRVIERRKQEEERQRQEEELRKQADELRLRREEKRRRELEDERVRWAQEGNDESWREWKPIPFQIPDGEFEHCIACVIRAPDGSFDPLSIICSYLPAIPVDWAPLHPLDEVVGNIVSLEPRDRDTVAWKFEKPWWVGMPHCATRNTSREVVIKALFHPQQSEWIELATIETVYDDFKDMGRFVEARVLNFEQIVLVPVSKCRTDRFELTRNGTRFCSSVDPRVLLVLQPESLRVNLAVTLQVQTLEANLLADLKNKFPHEMRNIITTSHKISLSCPKKKLFRDMLLSFALPLNPAEKRLRPDTGTDLSISRRLEDEFGRPKTARGSSQNDGSDEVHMMWQLGDSPKWQRCTSVHMQTQKNKDIVTLEMGVAQSFRLITVRTAWNTTEEYLQRALDLIEKSMTQKTVNLVLRQGEEDPTSVVILVCPALRLERLLKTLVQEGYSTENNAASVSKEVVLNERDTLHIQFRGNIQPVKVGGVGAFAPASSNVNISSNVLTSRTSLQNYLPQCRTLKMVYNSQMRNRIQLKVQEVDRYAQRAISCYRGCARVVLKEMVKRQVNRITEAGGRKIVLKQQEWVEEERVIGDLPMVLPKVPQPSISSILRAPFDFKSKADVVTTECLCKIAGEIGDEWLTLGLVLGQKQTRLQVIECRNAGQAEDAALEMLLSWVKGLKTSANKSAILERALKEVGRYDLVEAFLLPEGFRNQSAGSSMSYLRNREDDDDED